MPYYYFLSGTNFLYPLGTALSCFYLGQGKTRLVLFVNIGSQVVKILLAYLLIFGWGWIPALGLMGGAISTFTAQAGICLVLLWVFLNSKHAEIYQSRVWHLDLKLFWNCIQPGLSRATSRILTIASWAAIARLMASKGGDYLLILSIGGTVFLFLPFLGDAVGQAQTIIVSQIIGARNHHLLEKAFRSGTFLVFVIIGCLGIPLILFPLKTFNFLFPSILLEENIIREIFLGLWICFAFFTFTYVPSSNVLAFKDTRFLFLMGPMNWINGYLLMYLAIEKVHILADQFWLTLALMHGSTAFLYYWRMKRLGSKMVVSSYGV